VESRARELTAAVEFNPRAPADRLAQLERSIEVLARQIESLRDELRR
jgi:hypothetical protein